MGTITAILEADADGTLHLPLPAELRHGKIEVTATLKAVNGTSSTTPQATPEILKQRKEAFEKLRQLGGLRDVIPDPVAWQRDIRHLGDAIIAATALAHDLPLVTRNVDDFKHIAALKIINPFAASQPKSET